MGHGTPVLDAWCLAGSDLGLVNPEGVADADEESFGSEQAGDHLTPGLGACSVDERVPTGVEFTGSGVDICNVELDRGMGGRSIVWPLTWSEAGFDSIRDRPDSQVPGSTKVVHRHVIACNSHER